MEREIIYREINERHRLLFFFSIMYNNKKLNLAKSLKNDDAKF